MVNAVLGSGSYNPRVVGAGRMVAAVLKALRGSNVPGRKVRTPKGSVLGNAQAWKRDG
jgi:hypothetical protein